MNAAPPVNQSVRPPNRVSHRPVSLINGQPSFLFRLNEKSFTCTGTRDEREKPCCGPSFLLPIECKISNVTSPLSKQTGPKEHFNSLRCSAKANTGLICWCLMSCDRWKALWCVDLKPFQIFVLNVNAAFQKNGILFHFRDEPFKGAP